ncbi:MAG TPA: hypothetical protein VLG76_04000, partial [Rhabdochlamydiaceae bacterium]|nr:hypothetical protein [Rhabdochlamydiaceae bacterium]
MPTLISTDLGRKATFYLLSHKFSGKIQAEQLSLSWFGKQKIRGIQWANQREGLFFRCEEVSTSAPLWKLLLNHHLDELKMSCPHLELDAHFSPSLHTTKPNTPYLQCGFFPMSVSSNFGHQDDGKFLSSFSDDCRRQYRYADMAEAVVRKDAKKILQVGDQNLKTHSNFSINKSYFGNIFIDRGTLLVFSKNKLLASFQQVVSQIHLPEERFPIQLALIGQTEQDNVIGKFDIKAEINSLNFDQPNLEMQAKLVHFPIFGLDELLSYFDPSLKGLLAEGIGPSFDLDLDAKFQPQVQELHLLAQSSLVHAEVEAESFNGNLVLKNPAKLSFSLPSSLFKKFAFSLKNSPEIVIALEKLSLPYGFNWTGASFQSTVRISPTELIANRSNESIHLDGCLFSLSSNSLEKGLNFLSNSSLKMGNLNSQILLKADLKEPFSKSLQGNCQLQIQAFPLKIAELILSEKLIPIFGNSFDGSCTLNIDSESTNLIVKAATPLLKISEMKFRIDDQVSLLEPILADYHSSPRLSPIQLSIDQCTFPLRSWEKLSVNCHFQIPAIHHWMVEKLQGKISVNTLENISAEIAGGELQMKGLFALNKEMKELQLKQPLSLDYVLSPTRFQTFFPPDAKTPLLLSPATLHLSIEPFCLSLTDSILKKLKTSASGSIDSLSLQYEQQMHKLKNIQFR